MNYSKRILETVRLMTPGCKLADIGCDHGYMCICALEQKIFRSAVASDIRPGPLSRAQENIRLSGYEHQISTGLSNGFQKISPDFDCAVICGMGGLLIRDILSADPQKWSGAAQLILGPHSETEELRSYILNETGFGIKRESVVKDSGKFYVLLDVRPKNEIDRKVIKSCLSGEMLRFGNPLLQEDPEEYRSHLKTLRSKTELALQKASAGGSERSAIKMMELRNDIDTIDRLLCQEMR